jgi:hypothetical protein
MPIQEKLIFHFCKEFTVEEEATWCKVGNVLVAASKEAKYSNDYIL